MAARSRATSRSASRGDTSLRAAINELVGALPLGSLTKRLASVESAVGRLEREARRVLGGLGTRSRSAGGAAKRTTAKRATPKKSTTKRATAKRTTAKTSAATRGTAKRSTAASTAGTGSKRSTAAKRSTATRARGGASRGSAVAAAAARPRRGARSSVPPVTGGGGVPSAMGEEDLSRRREQLLSELGPAPRAFSEPPGVSPDDDELASEELTFAAGAPEAPGPLP